VSVCECVCVCVCVCVCGGGDAREEGRRGKFLRAISALKI
jgi:hypothetical protein